MLHGNRDFTNDNVFLFCWCLLFGLSFFLRRGFCFCFCRGFCLCGGFCFSRFFCSISAAASGKQSDQHQADQNDK